MDPAQPIQSASQQFIQAGLLGTLCVVFAVVIYLLWRAANSERAGFLSELKAVQEARIDDAKAVQTQLLDLIKQCTTALESVANALEQQKDATGELRTTLREFGGELRALGEDVRKGRQP